MIQKNNQTDQFSKFHTLVKNILVGFIFGIITIGFITLSGCSRGENTVQSNQQPNGLSQSTSIGSNGLYTPRQEFALSLYDSNKINRGWGGVVNGSGRVLTAHHVLEESDYRLSLDLGVEMIHLHPELDLALIKIDSGLTDGISLLCEGFPDTDKYDKSVSHTSISESNKNFPEIVTLLFTSPIMYGMSGLPVSDSKGNIRGVLIRKDQSNPTRGQAVLFSTEILQWIEEKAKNLGCEFTTS